MLDVVVIGDINMETNIDATPSPNRSHYDIGSLSDRIGGRAIDISVLCSHLGLRASLVSSIGMDASGILSILEKSNIDYSHLIISETKTGKRINIDTPGSNISYIFRGANRHLSPSSIDYPFLKGCRMVHICPGNIEMTRSVPGIARETLVSCHLDRSCPIDILNEKMDFVFIDASDALALTGKGDVAEAGRELLGKGPLHVILTDRGKGVAVFTEGEGLAIKAPIDMAYDATDYDESFFSGFIYRYLKTSNLKSSLSFGLAFQLLSHEQDKKILFQDVDIIEDKMYSIMRLNNE